MNQRKTLIIVVIALLAIPGVGAAFTLTAPHGFAAAPDWVGPIDERPNPTGSYFDGKQGRVTYVANDTGQIATIEIGDSAWEPIDVHLVNYTEAESPPADAIEGTIFWNGDRQIPGWYDGTDVDYPTVGDDVITSTNTVANTATETEVYSAAISSGSLEVGRVYRMHLMGQYSTNDASDTFTLRVHIGGVQVASVTSIADQVSGSAITVRTTITVRSIGSSGEVMAHTEAVFNDKHIDIDHGSETIDTTHTNMINATVDWSVAEAGDSVSVSQGYMEEIA